MKLLGKLSLNNLKGKMLSFKLGIFFSLIVFELCLRIVGYIDSFERDPIKSYQSKKYRVMNVGNSYTAGAGVPKGESYSAHLQRLLEKDNPSAFEVINRGIGNVNTSYISENLQEWLNIDRPHLVFVMVGEPNQWNKYGYGKFLESYKGNIQKEKVISWDYLRWSKIFRLIELWVNSDIKLGLIINQEYSTYFKTVRLTHDNSATLGYLWLGSTLIMPIEDMKNLTKEQDDEAIEYLNYIYEKDKNYVAAAMTAYFYLIKKNDKEKYLEHINKAISELKHFNYFVYLIHEIGKRELRGRGYLRQITTQTEKLEQLPRELPVEKMEDWFYRRNTVTFSSKDEEKEFLLKLMIDSPENSKIPQSLLAHSLTGDEVFDVLQRNLKLVPLSSAADYYSTIDYYGEKYPVLREKFVTLLNELSVLLNDPKFKEVVKNYHLEKEWIIHDLNKIIKMIQDSGAKVVIQTYPPYKDGSLRTADRVLREWWHTYSNKTDVIFMDLGLMLKEKFSSANNGKRFYSTQYGETDQHQSELGNYEIALLMKPYVLKLRVPAPQGAPR